MGRQPVGRFGRIDKAAMRAEVVSLLDRLGVTMDPDRPTEGLSIADQQIIEIAKAISLDARVLIMDEPTAALAVAEVEAVLELIRRVSARGVSVILITHRLQDLFLVCDRIMVMYEGTNVADRRVSDTSLSDIVNLIVGEKFTARSAAAH